jgi:hypothetical protein
MGFTVSPVRHKIYELNVRKSTSSLGKTMDTKNLNFRLKLQNRTPPFWNLQDMSSKHMF